MLLDTILYLHLQDSILTLTKEHLMRFVLQVLFIVFPHVLDPKVAQGPREEECDFGIK